MSKDDDGEIATEKPENIIIQSSQRGARLKEELLGKIIPWEKITVSLDNFPYYVEEDTKTLLKECVASNLKQGKLRKYRAGFQSSSRRILLQSIPGRTIPGTEICKEKLVSALAREMQVPLLKLDDDQGCDDEEDRTDSDDEIYEEHNHKKHTFKKGDRVVYIGSKDISFREANNRTLTQNGRGEVYEVDSKRVAVVFNICGLERTEVEDDERNAEILQKAIVTWLDVGDVSHDHDARTHDCYIAMEMIYQVLQSQQPAIVYFSDSFLWPKNSSSYSRERDWFFQRLRITFNQLPERVVLISPEREITDWHIGHREMKGCPKALHEYIRSLRISRGCLDPEVHELFTNVICINPPMDEILARTFVKQIRKDWSKVISEGNFRTLKRVLKDHKLSCTNLEHPNVGDMILERKKAEKIVGWATNHYLSSCPTPCVNDEILQIPHESIKLAISRLLEEENYTFTLKKQPQDCNENKLASTVVCPGLKFDDVGALDHVKKALYETVILPLKRPELFSGGKMLKPCKGVLLFGPSGTGKTLIAKALAMESGAKFMNITAATDASMKEVFDYAIELAPVIIFVDELDSFLGARAYNHHNRKKLNEFMEAWDGLDSNDSQGILVLGATNRPFDLDEAVVRHMARRIYVGIPDVSSRSKILKTFLNKQNLEPGFSFEQLARATEGYSGSDLKNLCAAAAFRPLEEFLEQKGSGDECNGFPILRPLSLNDFINSKAKVKPSVASNARSTAKLRDWMEQYEGSKSSHLATMEIHARRRRRKTVEKTTHAYKGNVANGFRSHYLLSSALLTRISSRHSIRLSVVVSCLCVIILVRWMM